MNLIHENLEREAEEVARAVKQTYGINSNLINRNLADYFAPLETFNGYWASYPSLLKLITSEFPNKVSLVLTSKDLYTRDKSQEDDWIFGYQYGNLLVGSTARMKRFDNKSSSTIEVPLKRYLKRVVSTSLHEIGHDVIKAAHYQMATWVNKKTGNQLHLGKHCTDNKCIMYEVVDIKAPLIDEGYMQLGSIQTFDNSLDDLLDRIYSDLFCTRCKDSIKIDERYR